MFQELESDPWPRLHRGWKTFAAWRWASIDVRKPASTVTRAGSVAGLPLLTFIERVPAIQLPRLDRGGLLLLGSRLIVNPRLAE